MDPNKIGTQSRSMSRQSHSSARSSRASHQPDHTPNGEDSEASTLSPGDLSAHSHAKVDVEESVVPS